jgi:hypothetical protein
MVHQSLCRFVRYFTQICAIFHPAINVALRDIWHRFARYLAQFFIANKAS